MGLLSWFKDRGRQEPPLDPKTRWLLQRIDEAKRERDIRSLAAASEALTAGGMAFGMVVADFPDRARARDAAIAALRAMLPDVPDAHADEVFETILRAQLPIDLEHPRAQIVAARRAAAHRQVAEVRSAIATASAPQLLEAYIALRSGARVVLGVELASTRETGLITRTLERLRAIVADATDDEIVQLWSRARRQQIDLGIDARHAEIMERRRRAGELAVAEASGTEPRDPELERAIIADRDDREAYSVLADFLQQRGHARGELMALQLRAETDPSLQAEVDSHLAAHAGVLLGPLAPHQRMHDGTERPAFVWRRGFIVEASLSIDDDAGHASNVRLVEVLDLLLAHPSARFLRRLALGINGTYHDDDLDEPIEMLVRNPPAHLEELVLGDFTRDQCEISWFTVGNVAPLWPVLPGLRRLEVNGGTFELGAIEHARLEHLEVRTGTLSSENAGAIARLRCPRLRHLDVWYGDSNYGAEGTIADADALIRRDDLRELVHLGLVNTEFSDELCTRLRWSSLMPQLRELDLSLGTMSPDGARELAAAAGKFPHLEELDVSENYLDEDSIELLCRAFPRANIIADDQRELDGDDDERYPAVGE